MSADYITVALPRGTARALIGLLHEGAVGVGVRNDADAEYLIEQLERALKSTGGGAMGAENDTGELVERKDGRWAWRRKSWPGGDIVATDGGQGYENEADARHMAESRNPGIVFEVAESEREETEGDDSGDH